MRFVTRKQFLIWLTTLALVPIVNVAFQKLEGLMASKSDFLAAVITYWFLNVIYSAFSLTIVFLLHSYFMYSVVNRFKDLNRWKKFLLNLSSGIAFISLYEFAVTGTFFRYDSFNGVYPALVRWIAFTIALTIFSVFRKEKMI